MEVYADLRQKVDVNPLDVIQGLINKEINHRDWIFVKDGVYYVGFEESAGQHSFDSEKEITKEKYEYIQALEFIKSYIKNNKKNN